MIDEYKKESLQMYGVIFLFLFIVIFIITTNRSYVDISNLCMIRIKENVLSHEKKNIKSALYQLKKTDILKYKSVCKYTDTINLKRCFAGDPRVDSKYGKINEEIDGCYVRGTHTIYLRPNDRRKNFNIEERIQQIVKYSSFNKKFWEEDD